MNQLKPVLGSSLNEVALLTMNKGVSYDRPDLVPSPKHDFKLLRVYGLVLFKD